MKRACLILLPAAVLACAGLTGCNDESKPAFTRINVTPGCGVVPLLVEGYAVVSGGDESGSPTGGNNNLDITWSFGDGHTANTSIAYNRYTDPGDYLVTVRAEDPSGNTTTITYPVRALADSLVIEGYSNFPDGIVTTADTVRFDCLAASCDIDPDSYVPDDPATAIDEEMFGDYVKLTFEWDMDYGFLDVGDPFNPDDDEWFQYVYRTKNPVFSFPEAGEYDVVLAMTYPAWAVTRWDTLHFVVSEAP
ncbi:MAG: PKD domain-containing protein [Candidatus Krumholzibacteriia bacterium]